MADGIPPDIGKLGFEDAAESRVLTKMDLAEATDRKSTRLNSSHKPISYAVFCLKKKKKTTDTPHTTTY